MAAVTQLLIWKVGCVKGTCLNGRIYSMSNEICSQVYFALFVVIKWLVLSGDTPTPILQGCYTCTESIIHCHAPWLINTEGK